MSNLSPIRRNSISPSSSNEERSTPPPPITMPAEIKIFQKENNCSSENNNIDHDLLQTPSLGMKKSFCIDALLAKTQSDPESGDGGDGRRNHFLNNNYKDNLISRDLNSSPDDNLSR